MLPVDPEPQEAEIELLRPGFVEGAEDGDGAEEFGHVPLICGCRPDGRRGRGRRRRRRARTEFIPSSLAEPGAGVADLEYITTEGLVVIPMLNAGEVVAYRVE